MDDWTKFSRDRSAAAAVELAAMVAGCNSMGGRAPFYIVDERSGERIGKLRHEDGKGFSASFDEPRRDPAVALFQDLRDLASRHGISIQSMIIGSGADGYSFTFPEWF